MLNVLRKYIYNDLRILFMSMRKEQNKANTRIFQNKKKECFLPRHWLLKYLKTNITVSFVRVRFKGFALEF